MPQLRHRDESDYIFVYAGSYACRRIAVLISYELICAAQWPTRPLCQRGMPRHEAGGFLRRVKSCIINNLKCSKRGRITDISKQIVAGSNASPESPRPALCRTVVFNKNINCSKYILYKALTQCRAPPFNKGDESDAAAQRKSSVPFDPKPAAAAILNSQFSILNSAKRQTRGSAITYVFKDPSLHSG